MEMGSSQVNEGAAMTRKALLTGVSNAVKALYPTPTTGSRAWKIGLLVLLLLAPPLDLIKRHRRTASSS
ncbi:hypothetical protein BOTCAL_0322g00030 [Botryotinia calthae]|uniref:Uncharacterized protein n=1 Tax=Botryotinia calthae TaxID=38488 RepID=A0A4Y8CW58_9HELO|nr:hypothetical protein BOTCAL_0322g00030 [Botryotinia calthae]